MIFFTKFLQKKSLLIKSVLLYILRSSLLTMTFVLQMNKSFHNGQINTTLSASVIVRFTGFSSTRAKKMIHRTECKNCVGQLLFHSGAGTLAVKIGGKESKIICRIRNKRKSKNKRNISLYNKWLFSGFLLCPVFQAWTVSVCRKR